MCPRAVRGHASQHLPKRHGTHDETRQAQRGRAAGQRSGRGRLARRGIFRVSAGMASAVSGRIECGHRFSSRWKRSGTPRNGARR